MRLLKSHKTYSVIVIAIVALLFFMLVSKTPLFADDYVYFYSFKDGFGTEARDQQITNAEELILSQIGHYKYMNGRIFAHALAQIFVSLDKTVFDIAAAIAFCGLGVLICYHGVGKLNKIRPVHLLLVFTSLFLFAPSFGQSYLWLTGSCNYMFTFVAVLLFLIPYRTSFETNTKSRWITAGIATLLMAAFGVLAGETNENIGCALVVVLAIYLVAYYVKHKAIKAWMIGGWLGTIAGLLVMLLAPGNKVRTGGSLISFDVKSIVISVVKFTADIVEYMGPILAVICILMVILALKHKSEFVKISKIWKLLLDKYFFAVFYGLFFLGAVYAMVIPAQFPARAWSHPLAILLILFLYLIQQIPSAWGKQLRNSRVSQVLCVCLTIALVMIFAKGSFSVNTVALQHATRVEQIQSAKQEGKDKAGIASVVSSSRFVCQDEMGDISVDEEYWINTAMAKYYGIGSVYKNEDVYS